MKFIWRYLFRKMRDIGNDNEVVMDKDFAVPSKISSTSDTDWGDGLNINVHAAHGGKIVTFRRYDRKTDRNNHNVYVIPEDHDFERELGKLITLEAMRG